MEIKRYKVFVTIGYIGIETRNVSFLSTRELGASLRTEQWHKYELSQFRGSPYMRHNAAAFPFSTTPPLSPRFFRPRITHWKTFRAATQLICPVVASFRFISAGKEKERIVHHALSRLSHGRHVLARHSASAREQPRPLSPLLYLTFLFFPPLFFTPPPSLSALFVTRESNRTIQGESRLRLFIVQRSRNPFDVYRVYRDFVRDFQRVSSLFFFYLQPFRPKRCTIVVYTHIYSGNAQLYRTKRRLWNVARPHGTITVQLFVVLARKIR